MTSLKRDDISSERPDDFNPSHRFISGSSFILNTKKGDLDLSDKSEEEEDAEDVVRSLHQPADNMRESPNHLSNGIPQRTMSPSNISSRKLSAAERLTFGEGGLLMMPDLNVIKQRNPGSTSDFIPLLQEETPTSYRFPNHSTHRKRMQKKGSKEIEFEGFSQLAAVDPLVELGFRRASLASGQQRESLDFPSPLEPKLSSRMLKVSLESSGSYPAGLSVNNSKLTSKNSKINAESELKPVSDPTGRISNKNNSSIDNNQLKTENIFSQKEIKNGADTLHPNYNNQNKDSLSMKSKYESAMFPESSGTVSRSREMAEVKSSSSPYKKNLMITIPDKEESANGETKERRWSEESITSAKMPEENRFLHTATSEKKIKATTSTRKQSNYFKIHLAVVNNDVDGGMLQEDPYNEENLGEYSDYSEISEINGQKNKNTDSPLTTETPLRSFKKKLKVSISPDSSFPRKGPQISKFEPCGLPGERPRTQKKARLELKETLGSRPGKQPPEKMESKLAKTQPQSKIFSLDNSQVSILLGVFAFFILAIEIYRYF